VRRAAPILVPPRWQILAPDEEATPDRVPVRLAAGPGFGDGRHPTTQVCLQAIGTLAPRERPWRLLDVGSGSGILSIAGALLGADVDAVEIDPSATAHAAINLRLNGVADRVRSWTALDAVAVEATFDLVVANILRGVLLDLAPAIAARSRGSTLALSGLVSTDVPETIARYAPLLGGARPAIYEREEWRALVWRQSMSS
jgi:ribosomal protein L11 methyltransferase